MKGMQGEKLVRYVCVGFGVFLIDYSVFLLMGRILNIHPLLVNPVSRTVGALACFLGHRRFTFAKKESHHITSHFLRFICIFLLSYALSELYLWLLLSGAGIPMELAKPMAEGFVFAGNFFLLGRWVFV